MEIEENKNNFSKKRYVQVFFITLFIFIFTLWISNEFSNKKINQLKDLEDQISLNILSTETRFSILEKTSCEHIIENKENDIGFNTELTNLAKRVKFMESQLGLNDENVISLKNYYALLQIKDYLLTKEFHSRCNEKTVSILYFFDAKCNDCSKQSIILDKVTEEYPEIRVYWFDKDIDTPALQTLVSLFKVSETPALVIGEKTYTKLNTLEEIESHIPETKLWKEERIKKAQQETLEKSKNKEASSTQEK